MSFYQHFIVVCLLDLLLLRGKQGRNSKLHFMVPLYSYGMERLGGLANICEPRSESNHQLWERNERSFVPFAVIIKIIFYYIFYTLSGKQKTIYEKNCTIPKILARRMKVF